MNCSPTLTAEEFRILHNGLWELDRIVDKLLHSNIREGERLQEIAQSLRSGLAGAYRQDRNAFEAKSNCYEQFKMQMGFVSIWSIFEVDDFNNQHRFGSDVNRVIYRDHWGDNPVHASIQGPTWADLYAAADHCIRNSGDAHHVFIENFLVDREDSRTLTLLTGS